jgi:predicted dehydrogenase
MDDRRLKAAMIGVGDITMLHYPAYRDCPDAELVALCDVDRDLLRRRQAEWGVARTTTNYRELLDDPEIDIVEINTPHHLHRKLVVEALEAGKHVACQKPIATSIAEAEDMVAAARRARGRFRVLENFVFYPAYQKAKELIDAGEIGEPLSIRFKLGTSLAGGRFVPVKSELWHLLEYEQGRGQAVFDDGYHKLSLAIHLIGAIEAVKGFIDCSFAFIDIPAQLIWKYKGRKTLGGFDIAFQPNVYTHSRYFSADERVEIVGTRGMIETTCCTGQLANLPPLILTRDGRRTLFEDMDIDWQASFSNGIRDFPRAIKEGRDTLLTGERALEILRFAFALITAARLGREVRPDEVTDQLVKEARHG